MPQERQRCNDRTVIDGLEWYCNQDKGHEDDHAYLVKIKDSKDYLKPYKKWKQKKQKKIVTFWGRIHEEHGD